MLTNRSKNVSTKRLHLGIVISTTGHASAPAKNSQHMPMFAKQRYVPPTNCKVCQYIFYHSLTFVCHCQLIRFTHSAPTLRNGPLSTCSRTLDGRPNRHPTQFLSGRTNSHGARSTLNHQYTKQRSCASIMWCKLIYACLEKPN